jgi:hypothetical protein
MARLHDASVWVYEGIFADMMMVIDQRDGKKYEVENFAPDKYGEYPVGTWPVNRQSPHNC